MSNNLSANPSQKDMKELENLYNLKQFLALENKAGQLLKKYSKNVNLQNILGIAFQAQGKFKDSIEIFEKVIKLKPNYYLAYYNLGNVQRQSFSLEGAKTSYKKCIEINPRYIDAYIGLGLVLVDLYKLEESENVFKKALKLQPENAQLHRHLSVITKYSTKNSHIKEMEKIIYSNNITDEQKIHLSFALGKAHEDIKCYDQAFSFWEKGNLLQRKKINYSTSVQTNFIQQLKNIFTKNLFEKFGNSGNRENKLIFIVGMPRSGTTLVQQILSCHPNVFGLGEKNEFYNMVKQHFFDKNSLLKNDLYNYDSINFCKIGDNYIKNLKHFPSSLALKSLLAKSSPDGTYFSVKDPLNFTLIGFIKLIFPKAKIVHCVRNPLDNCISLFKNYFAGGVDFSYDLIELGEYYNLYLDLMEHWSKVLPNHYVSVFYEELINNQKNETEKLLKACNLEWNENCMQFHKYIHAMGTGSNSINIHRSVYKSSMQYWKHYERQLKPLIEILKI